MSSGPHNTQSCTPNSSRSVDSVDATTRISSSIPNKQREKVHDDINDDACPPRPGIIRNAISSVADRTIRSTRSYSQRDPTSAEDVIKKYSLNNSQYQQRTHFHELGLAEEGYHDENPWYGQARQRPVFSLGKPLPHIVRRRIIKKPRHVPEAHDEETGIIDEVVLDIPVDEHGNVMTTYPGRFTETQGRSSGEETAQHEPRATVAGVTHGGKHNNAGQPVFEYMPGEEADIATLNGLSPRPTSHQQPGTGEMHQVRSPPDYKIDGEPIAKREKDAIEEGASDANDFRNWWARYRARHCEPLAEFLATGVAVFLGLTGTLSVNLSADQSRQYGTYETSCWAWGFAWMLGIYLGGGVSGAHMNPATSISLWLFRGFPFRQCLMYIFMQFIACIAAAALAYGIYSDSIHHVDPQMRDLSRTFVSTPQEWVSLRCAFSSEVVGGAIMMIAVLALGDDQNNPPGAGMHALVLGLLVTTIRLTLGYNTGTALNAASDFGARVIAYAVGYRESNVFQSGWWFYGPWAAALVGSITGCVLYDGMIFVGSESPINYRIGDVLKRRTKRAFRNS